jgi:hypothetical protein
MRPVTPVEAALVFALGGSALAIFIPAFVKNVHASRLSEPLEGLTRISGRAAQLADAAPQAAAYPETVLLTPANVPRGELLKDPPGTWSHPTWRLLDFSFETPHAYSFELASENGPELSKYRVTARGDLDGDGVLSRFEIAGSVKPGLAPQTSPLEVVREVE